MFNIKNPIELSMKLLSMMLIILMGNCNIAAQKYFEYIGGAAQTYETYDCVFYNNIYYLSGVYYNTSIGEWEGTISMIDAQGNLISERFWNQEPTENHSNKNIIFINDTLYTIGTYDRMDIANDANFCSISKVDKTDGELVTTNYFGQPDFSDLTYFYDGNSHYHAGLYYTESHYEPFILKTDSHFNVLWDTIYTQYNENLYNKFSSLTIHCEQDECDYWAYGNIEGDPFGPDGRLLFIKFNPDNGEILHTIIRGC